VTAGVGYVLSLECRKSSLHAAHTAYV